MKEWGVKLFDRLILLTYFDLAFLLIQMTFESERNQQFWFEPEETLNIVKDARD